MMKHIIYIFIIIGMFMYNQKEYTSLINKIESQDKKMTEKIEIMNNRIDELSDYIVSEEYMEIKYIDYLKNKYNIEAKDYIITTMELSFYTDLDCENGFGPVTATGKRLTDGHIANNQLDFGTNVYLEGYGMKVVEDRGSKKYFGDVSKVDVFVPRNNGETDSEYYRRVNDMGRVKVKGVIFK